MLNCCLEYERYLLLGDFYTTGMPIYFDATCSGSQLISLLFKIDKYAKSLNLISTKPSDVIGDFYSHLIEDY
jgi:DNA-directed RNA polymerase